MNCLCGHEQYQHIQWRGNCKACPMTKTTYKLAKGKFLMEPSCQKFRDPVARKKHLADYNHRYWLRRRAA